MKKILIFYASYGGGHYNAAKSVKEYIDANYKDCDTELIDCVEDKEHSKDSFERKIFNQEFREALMNSKLTDKEKNVILYRFGFVDGETHTLEEIGQKMGVTRERIRQIESKSIRKLRKDSNVKKFA